MDSTVSVGNFFDSSIGSVLVTTTSFAPHVDRRSAAGSERTPWVAAMTTSPAPASLEHLDRAGDGSAGVDHVVDQDAGATFDLTDDAGWT